MKLLSTLLLLTPSLTIAAEAKVVSEPLTTDSLSASVTPGGPISPIMTFSTTPTDSASSTSETLSIRSSTSLTSLGSESTTNTALHPSEPTGVSGGTGTATGASASASATTTSSEGAAFMDGGSSRVALVVALGAGLLGWVAF
ncbi:hypothetical protein N8I77_011248 [Diaporthe amygdali]|uniref:Uncharacterized protein n=1 Tax=Phomopsis amygdali TaxID=1214568 RepID=A0AAD9W0V6_PHOAM|nr:uncharacterized protein J7T55_004273 [Diaporthe amygdali]KAJ0109724.1 hypothetical protein J7T55_004273 [Diaporthe amygdali]KAK2599497.1 hypothetical protein N8I77_011248 [Diaporthe amygdali]